MIAWTSYEVGNHRITCPSCGRGDRDKTLGLTVESGGKGVAHCFRCEFTETFRPERGRNVARLPTIKAAQPLAKHDTLSAFGCDLWEACKPLSGIAIDYLVARHCRIPPTDGDLRWCPSLKHPTGYVGPALVGLVTDALNGEPLSLHRTWIHADGRKAEVNPPRLLLRGHRKQGGVIRLWPSEAVTVGLGVAEGIETALSLAWAYLPTWACIDAGNLRALPRLPGIESLIIGADNDPAGIDATQACAQRWAAGGAEVYITKQAENDLNDTLKEAA